MKAKKITIIQIKLSERELNLIEIALAHYAENVAETVEAERDCLNMSAHLSSLNRE